MITVTTLTEPVIGIKMTLAEAKLLYLVSRYDTLVPIAIHKAGIDDPTGLIDFLQALKTALIPAVGLLG